MRSVLVALIIYRNRYLISKIPSGEFAGQWEFPGGPANAETIDFQAVRTAIKERLGVDVFPYLTTKRLLYKSSDETIDLTLIKCSITNESKRFLSSNVPSEYKWISLPYVAHIDFAPRDKTIVRHLTNGLFLVPPKRIKHKRMRRPEAAGNRKQGFASMTPEKRSMIASLGAKAVHASGTAHKWTSEEASRAGTISAEAQKRSKSDTPSH